MKSRKRVSKQILKKSIPTNQVNDELTDSKIGKNLRVGWNNAFKKANSLHTDSMIDGDGNNLSSWDDAEWKW